MLPPLPSIFLMLTSPHSPWVFHVIYVYACLCVCTTHERNRVKFVFFPVTLCLCQAFCCCDKNTMVKPTHRRESSFGAYHSSGIRVHAHRSGEMWKQAGTVARAAESSHLRPQTASREGTENRVSLGKPQVSPRWHFLP